METRRLLLAVPVALGACLAAFFLSFAGVFTDAPAGVNGERLLSLGLSVAGHALLGFFGARYAAGRWWMWGLGAAAPSLLLLAWYAVRQLEANVTALCATYAAAALVGAFGGAWAGRKRE